MKTKIITFVATLLCLTTTLISCSSDEVDEAQGNKKELLLKKSKEFAKKYGVEMELNEDSLDVMAHTLTVEQMEKDYQKWAEAAPIRIEVSAPTNNNSKKSKNGIKLAKRIKGAEYIGFNKWKFNCHFESNESFSGTFELYTNSQVGELYMSWGDKVCQGTMNVVPGGYLNSANDYDFLTHGNIYYPTSYYRKRSTATGYFSSKEGNYILISGR